MPLGDCAQAKDIEVEAGAAEETAAAEPAKQSAAAKRRLLQVILGLVISGIFAYLCLRQVELSRVFREIRRVSWLILSLSLFSRLLGFLWASWRTSLIFPSSSVTLPAAFRSVLLAFAVSNILPLRMGELVRTDYLARISGVSRTACLGIVAFERLFDFFCLALIAIPVLALTAIEIPGSGGLYLYLVLPALGILAAWSMSRPAGIAFFRRRIHSLGDRLGAAVDRRLGDLERGLRNLDSPRRFGGVLLATFGFWATSLLSVRIWMWAFGLDLPWYGPVVVLAYIGFGIAIPSSPGFIGTYHFFVIAALATLGVESHVATSFAMVGHFMAIVPYTLLSVPLLLVEFLRRRR